MPAPPAPASFTLTPASQQALSGELSGTLTITLNTAAVTDERFSLGDASAGGTFYPGATVTVKAGATTATFGYLHHGKLLATITATALDTVALGAHSASILVGAPSYDVYVFDSDGLRIGFPLARHVSFETLERGGYGQGRLETLATWEELSLTGGERVDVYYNGTLVYRGYVRIAERAVDGDGETWSLTLYGLMERTDKWKVRRRYAYSSRVDIAQVFQDLVDDVIGTRIAGLDDSDINDIGVTLQQFDAWDLSLSEAFNLLLDMAPNQAVWGFDVNGSGQDAIYLRTRSSTVAYRFSVRAGKVEALVYPEDTTRIVNRLILRGGRVSQPNLLRNGSFEQPLPQGETAGNLVGDYSFELNTTWAYNAGASRKGPGDTGGARTGGYWAELDQNGENITQTISGVDYRVPLKAWFWARREQAGNANAAKMTITGLDAGSSPVVGATVNTGFQDPGGVTPVQYTLDVDFSAYSTVTKIQVKIESNAGTASNDGIDIDDVCVIEAQGVWSSGWKYAPAGAASRDELDWKKKTLPVLDTVPYHGGYCVLVRAKGVASGSDYLDIRTSEDARVSVRGGQTYCVIFFVRGEDLVDNIEFTVGVTQINASGSTAATATSAIGPVASRAWTAYALSFTMDTAAVQAEVFFRARNNNRHYVDAAWFGEGAAPREISTGAGGYWEGDTYERVLDTDNALLVDLESGAAASITDYDERESAVTQETVTDEETAVAYATGYFNAHAVPAIEAQLTVLEPAALVEPDGTVQLLNLPSAPDPLFPGRISTSFAADGWARQVVHLGNDRADGMELLAILERRAK